MSHTITAEVPQTKHGTSHLVGLVAGIVALAAAVIVTLALAVAAWSTNDDVQPNQSPPAVESDSNSEVIPYEDCRPGLPC
jgi:hypothetical protein